MTAPQPAERAPTREPTTSSAPAADHTAPPRTKPPPHRGRDGPSNTPTRSCRTSANSAATPTRAPSTDPPNSPSPSPRRSAPNPSTGATRFPERNVSNARALLIRARLNDRRDRWRTPPNHLPAHVLILGGRRGQGIGGALELLQDLSSAKSLNVNGLRAEAILMRIRSRVQRPFLRPPRRWVSSHSLPSIRRRSRLR